MEQQYLKKTKEGAMGSVLDFVTLREATDTAM